ncbi:SLBB domain-containing protein [Crocinitomix algicola]|uniref:SLBB domain-containing protein n=1 Tax=Crocinitomix algicola TaxID=1740263 RepID=UPI00082A6018|nr:SLBB domain-containing protein [Crocinitomix algicola]
MKKLLTLFSFIFICNYCFSQDIIGYEDLSNFDVSLLTDKELYAIHKELNARNMTLADARPIVIEKGMSQEQFKLLEERLALIDPQEEDIIDMESKALDYKHIPYSEESDFEKKDGWIYGSEIFANKALSFEPNQVLSSPEAYQLGTGDQLEVVIFGVQQFSQTVRINQNGTIFLKNIGAVAIGGLQLGAASQLIKDKASKIYKTIQTGNSQISVTITDFKTIQVTMIGVIQPGNYALSSLSTVFNALHVAGGPNKNGTYREIQLIRNNTIYKTIDLYDFLTAGDLTGNVSLQNNDIIRVPTYQKRVEVIGEVKRPGLFELIDGETFDDLMTYCSGFNEGAYTKNIKLTTTTESEYKITTVTQDKFDALEFKSGDKLQVDKIRETYENRVIVSGAVFRPAEYELTDGMRVLDLLQKADGTTADAFTDRALIVRRDEKLQPEIIGVNLLKIQEDPSSEDNIPLLKDDELIVSSITDLKESQSVVLSGEVMNPGIFQFANNMSLYDLIILGGGLKTSASTKVEIARTSSNESNETKIIQVEIDLSLNSTSSNYQLQPNDVISVRKQFNYSEAEEISLAGEVQYPGTYAIKSENERVGSVIDRSGGLTNRANPKGIKIIRQLDINSTSLEDNSVVVIPINYEAIKKNPDSKANILIQEGDEIRVEKLVETTVVTGAVEMETEIPINGNKSAKYYIKASGGFKENANKKKTYVIYSNGMAKTTKRFAFFKFYPKPDFGSTIIVPEQAEKVDGLTTQEMVALSAILSSATGVTVAIISLLKP